MTSSAPSQSVPGQRYKFLVGSAEEAAALIRERLGERAQVLSVRQVEGEGLARFLRAPRLEVIASIPEEEPVKVETKKPPAPTGTIPQPPIPPSSKDRPPPPPRSGPPPSSRPEPKEDLSEHRLWSILGRAGLPQEFLARLAQRKEWQVLPEQPLHTALGWAAILLRDAVPTRIRPLNQRVVFFGSPGAGATTALCKQLATDVFIRQRQVCVMKLDTEDPNSTEGLATFCEALGICLLRSPSELAEVAQGVTVYFDIPGTSLNGGSGRKLRQIFQDCEITSRVLVVNAAYDREMLQLAYRHAIGLESTHVVFTHLDELPRSGKLWEFILDEGLTPLFASTGRNLAGDCETNLIELLVERTLSVALNQSTSQPPASV